MKKHSNIDVVSTAKTLGSAQYLLMKVELDELKGEEKAKKLQEYWDEFCAIMDVTLIRADIMYSKYATKIFAYQELFNVKGGEVPRVAGIDLKHDHSDRVNEITKYLDKKGGR